MAGEYDKLTAFHYSAFRPSLHSDILKECIEEDDKRSRGLDIGCGTGQSSIALANLCDNVIGIEPSKEMLKRSIRHQQVDYQYYDGASLHFPKNHFDIITFAGSLYYAKSQLLLDEVVRVGKNGAAIIVYDFEILLDEILEKLTPNQSSNQISNYDHQINFDRLDQSDITLQKRSYNRVTLEVSLENVSHLLLSSKDNYSVLQETFGADELYNKIIQKLKSTFTTKGASINANTYSTVYQIIK